MMGRELNTNTTSHTKLVKVGYFNQSEQRDLTEFIKHSIKTYIGEGNGNPLQYSCLGNPMDRGAWWATVYGVAKSQTQLKQLSVRPILVCLGYHNKIIYVGGLNNTDLLSHSFGGWKSKLNMPTRLVSGETLFPTYGWLTCVFTKSFCCTHTSLVSSISYNHTSTIRWHPHLYDLI